MTHDATKTTYSHNNAQAYLQLAQTRHSVRAFLPAPVPQPLLETLLHTARLAPSGANLQPGHFWYVQDAARIRLTDALMHAHRTQQPKREDYAYFPCPMPMQLRKRQVSAAQALYGSLGISRGDGAARAQQFECNYRFFDAPVALIVTISKDFGSGGFMDLGMTIHNLWMAAHAFGLGACAIGALASYPDVVRQTLGLPSDAMIVCGMALGYPDTQAPINATRTERIDLEAYFSVLKD